MMLIFSMVAELLRERVPVMIVMGGSHISSRRAAFLSIFKQNISATTSITIRPVFYAFGGANPMIVQASKVCQSIFDFCDTMAIQKHGDSWPVKLTSLFKSRARCI